MSSIGGACRSKKEEGRRRKVILWFELKQENGRGKGCTWLMFELSGEWAPLAPKLKVAGNPTYRSRMRSTTNRKFIAEKSNFQKYIFLMI